MITSKINSLNRFISLSIIGGYILFVVIDIVVLIITHDLSIIKWKQYLIKLINSLFFLLYLFNVNPWFLIFFSIFLFILNSLILTMYIIWVIVIPFPFYMFLHNIFLLTLMVIGPVTISIESFLKIRGGRKNEHRKKKNSSNTFHAF